MSEPLPDGAGPAVVAAASGVDEVGHPRVRLHHLFTFTAVMAVLLAIGGRQQDFSSPDFPAPQLLRTLQQGLAVLNLIPQAVAVTALAYGIVGYRRGRAFFNQPGHWLLVEISVITLLSLPVYLAARSVQLNPRMGFGDLSMIVMMIAGVYSILFLVGGRIAFNVYLAIVKCPESRWRNVFIAKAVSPVALGLGDVAVIVLALLAVAKDQEEQIPRDASHRCGVYVQIAISALTIVAGSIGIVTMIVVLTQQFR